MPRRPIWTTFVLAILTASIGDVSLADSKPSCAGVSQEKCTNRARTHTFHRVLKPFDQLSRAYRPFDENKMPDKSPFYLRLAVKRIINDVMELYISKEERLGAQVGDYMSTLNASEYAFNGTYSKWISSPPNLTTFVITFTDSLDKVRLLTPSLVRDIGRLFGYRNRSANKSGSMQRNVVPISNLRGSSKHIVTSTGGNIRSRVVQRLHPLISSTRNSSNRPKAFMKSGHMHKSNRKVDTNREVSQGSLRSPRGVRSKSQIDPRESEGDIVWWEPMKNLVDYVTAARKWFIFLEDLSRHLEGLEVQAGIPRAVEGKFLTWEGSSDITVKNLQEALERIQFEFKLVSLQSNIFTLVIWRTSKRLEYLNEIVRVTTKSRAVCNNISDTIVEVSAPIVFLSESFKCTTSNTAELNVLATIRLIIDMDFNAQSINPESSMRLFCLTPKLFIVGQRSIILTGLDGKPRLESNASGKPGLPGVNGGTFFGILGVVDGGSLTLTSNGGNGGPGQAGGVVQPIVVTCNTPVTSESITSKNQLECERCRAIEAAGVHAGNKPNPDACIVCDSLCCVSPDLKYVLKGGDGGKGGPGGAAGTIEVYITSNITTDAIKVIAINGSLNGTVGAGGKAEYVNANGDQLRYLGYELGSAPKKSKKRDIQEIINAGIAAANAAAKDLLVWTCSVGNKAPIRSPLDPPPNGEAGKNPEETPIPLPKPINFTAVNQAIIKFKIASVRGSHLFSRSALENWTETLNRNETIQSAYTTLNIVEEFLGIESASQGLNSNYELQYYYLSLSERALKMANNASLSNRTDDAIVLNFLYATALARRIAITDSFEPEFVVKIEKYLIDQQNVVNDLHKLLQDDIEEENQELQFQHINKVVTSYNARVQREIEGVMSLIQHQLIPEIDKIGSRLANVIVELLKKIKELKDQGEGQVVALKEARTKLEEHMKWNQIFNGLTIALNFIFGLPAIQSATSTILDTVNLWSNPHPGKPPTDKIQLSQATIDGNRFAALRYTDLSDETVGTFLSNLDAAETLLGEQPDVFGSTLAEIKKMREREMKVRSRRSNPSEEFPPLENVKSFTSFLKTRAFIKDARFNLTKLMQDDIKSIKKKGGRLASSFRAKSSRTTRIDPPDPLTIAEQSVGYVEGIFKAFGKYQMQLNKDKQELEELGERIKKAELKVAQLDDHLRRIESQMIPELENMFKQLSRLLNNLPGKSAAALDVMNWRIQSIMKDIKVDFFKQFTEGTGFEKHIERGLEQVQDVASTIVTLFQRIQTYQDQSRMANFTAALQLNIGYLLNKPKDPELAKAVRKLKYLVQGGVILKRFQLARSSYRMWSFPMVDPVLCNLQTFYFHGVTFDNRKGISNLLTAVGDRYKEMITTVQNSKTTIGHVDEHVVFTTFNHMHPNTPLLTWHNDSYNPSITELLNGGKVQLFADPERSLVNKYCDAVKFRLISLALTLATGDSGAEKTLNDILNDGYSINMVHGGSSYYNFANKTYLFVSSQLSIQASFQKDSKGEPLTTNAVYQKIRNGDITVSPFGFWTFEIVPLPSNNNGHIPLLDFENKVNLYLEGQGTCVLKKYAMEGKYDSPYCTESGSV